MKFSTSDFGTLKDAIASSGIDIKQAMDEYKKSGKSDTRFYWDLYWASKWADKNRDHNYNDSHIETAIKAAVRDLTAIKAPWIVLPMPK